MDVATPRASTPHKIGIQRLAIALASALMTLAAAEVALRLTFRGEVEALLASRRRDVAPDAQAILCIGDSYTFGPYYRAEESYPGRLEQLLRSGDPAEGDGAERWFVENGGIPAQNLAQVAALLPEQLARIRPKAVVILAGFNDRWNFAHPDPSDHRRLSGVGAWINDLVLVKLWWLATPDRLTKRADGHGRLRHFSNEKIAVEGGGGVATIDIDKVGARLGDEPLFNSVTARLRAIVAQVAAAGALPLLCSYPSPEPHFDAPSRAAQAVAAERGLPFIDLRAAFARQLQLHRYEELLIRGDRHPTDRGYWRMAVLVAQSLAEHGIWRANEPYASAIAAATQSDFLVAPLPEQLYPVTIARARGSPATFALTGPPAAHWKILLARDKSPAQHFGSIDLEMAADDLFARCVKDDRCEGTFDAAGRADFTLPDPLAEGARTIALAVWHDLMIGALDRQLRGLAGPIALD